LFDAMGEPTGAQAKAITARGKSLRQASTENRARHKQIASAAHGLTKDFVSARLGAALDGVSSVVFAELGVKLGPLPREQHNSWFLEPHAGGLGWGFPSALGAALADPSRVCVATMGDGGYMFANPTVCHQIAEALELPVLIIVLNNEEWGAVRNSVAALYPEGYAARANVMPLTSLSPSPEFTHSAAASRCWARRVDHTEELDRALREALHVVRVERKPALLDVRIAR
jgi:acetolactate synthase I/II/III large subunit